MGLFSTFSTRKPSVTASGNFSSGARNLSSHEVKKHVRGDLHDKLGLTKGEEVFNMLSEDLDKDGGFGGHSVSGREIGGMLRRLEENHQDNLHSNDIRHIEEILHKHFDD